MPNEMGPLDHGILRKIKSLELFDDKQLDNLAARLERKFAKPKQRIIGLGDLGDYSLYLLSGEAISRDRDGTRREVRAETDGVLQPIAQIRPSLYEIETLTPVEYLEIPNPLLTELSTVEETDDAEMEVEIIEQSEAANQLTISLCLEISNGSISLPKMPDVVQKIQQEFASDDFEVAKITGLIQSDPSISAQLLKIANSPLYRGNAPIETIQQAVTRLGMDVIRKQIMIYAASELFQSKTTGMKNRMQSLWKNSRKVSAFSRILATRCEGFEPEMAQMAGLLSDLGIVAILNYAQEHSELYGDEEALDQTIRLLHSQINGMLLYQWGLGDEIVTVGEESRNWFRNHRNEADLCDLVLIARYHSMTTCPLRESLPALAKVPAFAKLQPGFNPEDSNTFIKESEAEVAAIESMLGSV